MQLFPKRKKKAFVLRMDPTEKTPAVLDQGLLPTPDVGFFGRDETLLALDRAFDRDPIVLLHGEAGSGKTSTAAEFARWYMKTGGVTGPVLCTSFERSLNLAQVLDRIGQVFRPAVEKSGVNWLALNDAQRREVGLQMLRQTPVLWIWDNVEPVAGFPAGAGYAWSPGERRELADFLRAARTTEAKFLLTSRRDERGWLGDLATRVPMWPMPMTERLLFARALAFKHRYHVTKQDDWRSLLAFTQGNPLTLTVLVGQALREKLHTREQVGAFVTRLRSGEAAFEDEISEGRSRSLGASLAYGFAEAFTEEERHILALLHLFQGFIHVEVLRWMGNPEQPWCLPEVRGLRREEAVALLDRAADGGLLTPRGPGYYGIHPALPWFFRELFEQARSSDRLTAIRAFVEAMGAMGNRYHREYREGSHEVIAGLHFEEANLLHAHRLARLHGWWSPVTSIMQGLFQLYDHTGQRAEWKRLVDGIVPDYVHPVHEGPLSGREADWVLVNQYRVQLAREERHWAEAERLQLLSVDWARQRAAPALALPAEKLSKNLWNSVRTLAVSVETLGHVQRELGQASCFSSYEEALALSERIGDRHEAAVCAFNLGHAYKDIPALLDLRQAQSWYERSLELLDGQDRKGQGLCLMQLGTVAYICFEEARAAERPGAELTSWLQEAMARYHKALLLLPVESVADLGVVHNQLGMVYRMAGDLDNALTHYRKSIHYQEALGDLYGAAVPRFNVALALAGASRFDDASAFAHAALRGFESYGERAGENIQKTRKLIEEIREHLAQS